MNVLLGPLEATHCGWCTNAPKLMLSAAQPRIQTNILELTLLVLILHLWKHHLNTCFLETILTEYGLDTFRSWSRKARLSDKPLESPNWETYLLSDKCSSSKRIQHTCSGRKAFYISNKAFRQLFSSVSSHYLFHQHHVFVFLWQNLRLIFHHRFRSTNFFQEAASSWESDSLTWG